MSQPLSTRVSIRIRRWAMLACCLGAATVAGCQRAESPKKEGAVEVVAKPEAESIDDTKPPLLAAEVLDRMIIAYRKAQSYADAGTVHLVAEAGGEKIIDETANYAFTLEHPNKARLQAYDAMLVCDGEKMYGSIESLPGVVMVRPAPSRLTLKTLYVDRELAMALTQNFAGTTPQVMLLLADDPMKALLRDSDKPVLSESGKIEGRDCYRVQLRRPDGMATFWIDQESFILRRVVLPTDELRQAISREKPIDRISLVADFTGARIDGKIDPKAFAFEVPKGAEIVKFFPPQELAYMQLLNKKVPDFKFTDLDGKAVTPATLAGKVTVLDFWATWCRPCRQTLPLLQKVYEKFKDNPKVAFYVVNTEQAETKNQDIEKVLGDLKVSVPILRDIDQTRVALKFRPIPTTFVLGPDGLVQDCEAGGNPKMTEELTEKIEKLLAGENIYEKPMQQYQEQLKRYAKMLDLAPEGEPTAIGEPLVEERKLPEVKTAERSEPTTFKLASAWKCADLKSPGNLVVVKGNGGESRLLAVENWKSIAEIGLDGKLIALHKLKIDDSEVIGSLRTNIGVDGKRYIVAFLSTQQRCHVLDEDWNLVASYPEDALQNPHSGIADVELGDLAGDGTLKMYVSYWGVVGVQAASLEGKRLWSNRSISNVIGMAIGAADEKKLRSLYCTNNAGSLVLLDAQGERQGEIRVPDQMLHWIVTADLGDGQPLWCGMAASSPGENRAIGFSTKGEVLWDYVLPLGVQQQPIEIIIPGRVTREGPGQWILPGPDGSIHFISADGKPLDKFNYGAMLQGLATIEIDGQPALVVASEKGLEAWKVE